MRGNPNPSPATRFRAGVSGNPGGRPKGSLGADLRDFFAEEAKLKDRPAGHGVSRRQLLVRKLYDHVMATIEAGEPDPSLVRLLFAYHDGQPPEAASDDDPQGQSSGGKVLKTPGSRRRRDRDDDDR